MINFYALHFFYKIKFLINYSILLIIDAVGVFDQNFIFKCKCSVVFLSVR